MELQLSISEITLRIFFSVVVGLIIGINREEQGHSAGIRTTILICLAACTSQIFAQWLFVSTPDPKNHSLSLDLMRMPLGILTGVGFIGAGAIFKRPDNVSGVTTAATIWFVTVAGICIGGGAIILGLATSLVAFVALIALRSLEKAIPKYHFALITLKLLQADPSNEEVIKFLNANSLKLKTFHCSHQSDYRELEFEVVYQGEHPNTALNTLEFLKSLSGIDKVQWRDVERG